jgi:predicted phosphohydrolase
LHNNSYEAEGVAICGTKGYADANDEKLYNRETNRLKISIDSIKNKDAKKIAMLHYPPDLKFAKILEENKIDICVYGHLHGGSHKNAIYGTHGGVRYILTSCDYLKNMPQKIN